MTDTTKPKHEIKPKELWLWIALLLNVAAFILNVLAGSLFFIFLNGACVISLTYTLYTYYTFERRR